MICQKARLQWLADGDRNSKFFHAAIKARRARNLINLELPDGSFSSDRDLIGAQAVEHFSSLFKGPPSPEVDMDPNLFEKVITEEENQTLSAPLTLGRSLIRSR
ncbi:hypothetical protein QQ045_026819 [Rhodiola kirilowii]